MLKKIRPTKKDFEKFLEAFEIHKNKCNEKRKNEKRFNKYYLAVVDNIVSIETTNKYINEFVLLGYFYNLEDIQKTRELFKDEILKFYEHKYLE